MTLSPRLAALILALGACSLLQAQDLVPLKLALPKPMLVGTPAPTNIPNLERPGTAKRLELLVPKGTVNLALHKEVTSSDSEPVIGDLTLLTDGEKGGDEGNYVELGQGKQWVQIDLGQSAPLYAVAVWHYHSQARVYFNVVVQLSDDPNFLRGVTTIYNSDLTNALGLGAGRHHAAEMRRGGGSAGARPDRTLSPHPRRLDGSDGLEQRRACAGGFRLRRRGLQPQARR